MPKTMTKYQLEHFKSKVRRNFNPLIEEQELLVKQYSAEARKKILTLIALIVITEKGYHWPIAKNN